jgi:hypothetical protein
MANLSPRAPTPSSAKAVRTVSLNPCAAARQLPIAEPPRRRTAREKLHPLGSTSMARAASHHFQVGTRAVPMSAAQGRTGPALRGSSVRRCALGSLAPPLPAPQVHGTRAKPSGQDPSPTATAHCPSLDNLDDFRLLLHPCPLGMPQLPDTILRKTSVEAMTNRHATQ